MNLIVREFLYKQELRESLQKNLPVLLKNINVMKDKERLRNGSSLKETRKQKTHDN